MRAEHVNMDQAADSVELSLTSETEVLFVGGGTAGTIAVLAVSKNTTPQKVDLKDIREMLVNNGAIVPEK